jgi:excisionase family DNA binding protein
MNEPTHSSHHQQPDADMQRVQRQGGAGTLPKRYWRIDEVADYFAISERTVYRLLEDGALQTIRIRSCRRVALEEIKKFEERLTEEEPF